MDDPMTLRFTKMHGLGNDFMVLNLLDQHVALDPDRIRAWSDRHTGVGFDQLLLLQPATQPDCDFAYRIYNADGDPVEHCGNGARCITRFAIDKRLTGKRQLVFQMARGSIETRLEPDGQVTVDMRPPLLAPAEIPFLASAQALTYPLELAGRTCTISAVSMGNPHAVLLVDDVEGFPVAELGPALEQHPAFPGVSTPASCRFCIAARCDCASMSAAWARRSPAGPAPAQRWWRVGCAGCSTTR